MAGLRVHVRSPHCLAIRSSEFAKQRSGRDEQGKCGEGNVKYESNNQAVIATTCLFPRAGFRTVVYNSANDKWLGCKLRSEESCDKYNLAPAGTQFLLFGNSDSSTGPGDTPVLKPSSADHNVASSVASATFANKARKRFDYAKGSMKNVLLLFKLLLYTCSTYFLPSSCLHAQQLASLRLA